MLWPLFDSSLPLCYSRAIYNATIRRHMYDTDHWSTPIDDDRHPPGRPRRTYAPAHHPPADAVSFRAVRLQLPESRERRLRRAADEGGPRFLEFGIRFRRRDFLHRVFP